MLIFTPLLTCRPQGALATALPRLKTGRMGRSVMCCARSLVGVCVRASVRACARASCPCPPRFTRKRQTAAPTFDKRHRPGAVCVCARGRVRACPFGSQACQCCRPRVTVYYASSREVCRAAQPGSKSLCTHGRILRAAAVSRLYAIPGSDCSHSDAFRRQLKHSTPT